jgi:hypothetical protein
MSKLEQLLDEKFPESEISHIQRQAFAEGYKAAKAEQNKKMVITYRPKN